MHSLVGALVVLAACVHDGTGQGVLQEPAAPGQTTPPPPTETVSFVWQSDESGNQGSIAAALPDGRDFQGTFVQITSSGWEEYYLPYWTAWTGPTWANNDPWYTGGQMQFVTHYSGQALANLTAYDGTHMRCTFKLIEPSSGMAGGGVGNCQLSTHETVFDAVLEVDE